MLIARACRALGDEEGAQLELESARELFGELGAIPASSPSWSPLTRRPAG
jgi:hypothetical protein